jgi:hypothetical protein
MSAATRKGAQKKCLGHKVHSPQPVTVERCSFVLMELASMQRQANLVIIDKVKVNFVRFVVFKAVTMKNAVFWDIKIPVRTSQETYYVSTTESSQLMLCKI